MKRKTNNAKTPGINGIIIFIIFFCLLKCKSTKKTTPIPDMNPLRLIKQRNRKAIDKVICFPLRIKLMHRKKKKRYGISNVTNEDCDNKVGSKRTKTKIKKIYLTSETNKEINLFS